MRFALVLILLAGWGCSDAQFRVEYPSPYSLRNDHERISIFGVFKDGRIDEAYWRELGPRLADVLTPSPCELFVDERLVREEPDEFAAIENDARENGLGKSLLQKFAARATGDVIMAVTVFGHPSAHTAITTSSMPASQSLAGNGMGGGGGNRRNNQSGMHSTAREGNATMESAYDVDVSFYSVERHDTVTELNMHYTGASFDIAWKEFATRLRTLIPDATCVGWKKPPAP